MTKKEFGRYSVADLKALSSLVVEIEKESTEVQRLISSTNNKLSSLLQSPFYWANLYQLPFLDLITRLTILSGLSPQISAIAANPDPQAELISALPTMEFGSAIDHEEAPHVFCLLMAIQRNIRALGFYSQTLGELVIEVEHGSDKAFFDAVLIDRSILACPPFANRMALAEMRGDKDFFDKLGKRLKLSGPSKKMKHYAPLRVCLYALEQEGCLASLSEQRAYEVFCLESNLYPEQREGDTSRSLKRFIQRWQRDRAT